MGKVKDCPQCIFPMEYELKRKSKPYVAKVEYFVCNCCGHKERIASATEYHKLEILERRISE